MQGYSNYYYGCNSCYNNPCSCNTGQQNGCYNQQNSCTPNCTACPTQVKDFCVFYTGNTLPCTGITTGNTLNTIVKALDAKLCNITPPSGNINILVKKVSLTSTQILNLSTTPIELVPAPTIGQFISVISITASYNFVSLEYNTYTTLIAKIGTSSGTLFIDTDMLNSTESFIETFVPVQSTILANTALILTTVAGNPLGGNSTLDVYITYNIMNL